jgi:hypothetical protein
MKTPKRKTLKKTQLLVTMVALLMMAPLAPATEDSPLPPDSGTNEQEQQFIDLWSTRIQNQEWFNDYVNSDGISQDILDEGFHGLDQSEQIELVNALFMHFYETDAGYRLELEADPDTMSERIEQTIAMLFTMIFVKDEFKQDTVDQPELTEEVAEFTSNLEGLVPQLQDAVPLEEVELNYLMQEPASLSDAIQVLVPTAPIVPTDINGDEILPEIPLDIVDIELPSIPDIFLPELDLSSLSMSMNTAGPLPAPLDWVEIVGVVDQLTYDLCATTGTTVRCTESIPIGTPGLVDATGNGLPDVEASFGPDLTAIGVVSLGYELSVTKLTSTNVHTYIVHQIPGTTFRMSLGLDGLASGLASTSTAAVSINELQDLLMLGILNLDVQMTHTNPTPNMGMTYGIADLAGADCTLECDASSYPGSNPTYGRLGFGAAISSFDANLVIESTSNGREISVTTDLSSPSKLTYQMLGRNTAQNSQFEFSAVAETMPLHAELKLSQSPGFMNVDYDATSAISSLVIGVKTIDNLLVPNNYNDIGFLVSAVPKSIDLDIQTSNGYSRVNYIGSQTISDMIVEGRTYAAGIMTSRFYAALEDLPTQVEFTATRAATNVIDWDMNVGITKATLLIEERLNDIAFLVQATSVGSDGTIIQTGGEYLDVNVPGGIGLIEVQIQQNQAQIQAFNGDHLSVNLPAIGGFSLSFELTGLKRGTYDDRSSVVTKMDLIRTGSNQFQIQIDAPIASTYIYTNIEDLPAAIGIEIWDSSIEYDASSTIDEIVFYAKLGVVEVYASITDVPSYVEFDWTQGSSRFNVAFTASSRITEVYAWFKAAPNSHIVALTVQDISPFFNARMYGDTITIDARASSGSSYGSSYIGSVQVQYGSAGFLKNGPYTTDHAAVWEDTDGIFATFQYTGFRYLRVDPQADGASFELRNTAARIFKVYVSMSDVLVLATVDKVPSQITAIIRDDYLSYSASSSVNLISIYLGLPGSDYVSATLQGLPSSIYMDWHPNSESITWSASSAITAIDVNLRLTAYNRAWTAGLDIDSVPRTWTVSWADDTMGLYGTSSAIGKFNVWLTSFGTYYTLAGDHMYAYARPTSGDYSGSFQLSNIKEAVINDHVNGFNSVFEVGTTKSFDAVLNFQEGTTKAYVSLDINNLPNRFTVSKTNGDFTYTGTSNFDLFIRADVGHTTGLAYTPTPPSVHGIAVRDGDPCGGSCTAYKAYLGLYGLPTYINFDASGPMLNIDNFNPASGYDIFIIDVELDDTLPKDLDVYAYQQGMSGGADFQFGPPSITDTSTSKTLSVPYTASRTLGFFEMWIDYGNLDSYIQVSQIPASITVYATMGITSSTVGVDASSGVNEIFTRVRQSGSTSWEAGVSMTDVPADVSLTFGLRALDLLNQDVALPQITYYGSADTLDVSMWVGVGLYGGTWYVGGDAVLNTENLARQVTTSFSTFYKRMTINSWPVASDKIEMELNADLDTEYHYDDCIPGCGSKIRLEIDFDLNEFSINADTFYLRLYDVDYFQLKFQNLLMSASGTFDQFNIGYYGLTGIINFDLDVRAIAEWSFAPDTDLSVFNANYYRFFSLSMYYHLSENDDGVWREYNTLAPCSWTRTYNVAMNIRPDPYQVWVNGVVMSDPGASQGNEWVVGFNPERIVPDIAMELATAVLHPYGDLSFSTPCR